MSLYGAKRPPAGETPTTEIAAVPGQAVGPVTGPAPAPYQPDLIVSGLPAHHHDPAAVAAEPVSRRGPRRALVAGGLVVAVLAAIGGTAGYAYSGEVPRGTEVLGVDLGGQSRESAAALLRAELDRRPDTFAAPFTVKIGDQTAEVKPADVGLTVDVPATVAATMDDAPGPIDLLFKSRTIEPVVTVDAALLDTELRKTAGRTGRPMTPASIVYEGTTPKPNYPTPGQDLNPEKSAEAVRAGWLSGHPVVVPLVEAHPTTTREEVDQLVAELAKPAVAAPVTVTTERGSFTIPPAAIAKSLLLNPDNTGKIVPAVDEKKLTAALTSQLTKVEVKPKDATVTLQGGKPQVVASTGGHAMDTAALSRDLLRGAVAQRRARGQGRTQADRAEDQHRRDDQVGDQGTGFHLHHEVHRWPLLPAQSQHRDDRQGGGRRGGQAGRDVLPQQAHRRSRLRPGLQGRAGDPGRQAGAGGRRRRRRSSPPRSSTRRTTPGWRTSNTSRTRTGSTGIRR